MSNNIAAIERSGQTGAPQGTERAHTLIVLVNDRPGSVDRVVGLLRRRRANMQTLVLAHSERPEVVRVTIVVKDSEVGVDQLVEQLRKIVDVRQVTNLSSQQAVTRELALIKVNNTESRFHEIIERSQLFGAYAADVTPEAIILEVVGSEEKVTKLVELLREYGIREIARSGSIAMARGEL